MKKQVVKESIVNESIKHLSPRSDEEVWKYYLDLIQTSGQSLKNIDEWKNPESFKQVSKAIKAPLSDMYIIPEEEEHYDTLAELFYTLVDGEKPIWIKVDESDNNEMPNGDWQCFPSKKLARWISADMYGVSAWIFSRKFFKNFKINEGFDSPGTKAKYGNVFSKEDLIDMSYPQRWKNLFQHGSYHGKDSGDLNTIINDALYKRHRDILGTIEMLYRSLIHKLPEFKDFEIYDTTNSNEMRLIQEKTMIDNVTNETYNVRLSLNIKVHKKHDKDLGYQKGKIRMFFSPDLTSNKAPNWDIAQQRIPKNIKSLSLDLDDEPNEEKLERSLQGFPDKEDYQLCRDLTISYKNLTLKSFLQTISELKEAIRLANKYFKEKYGI